MTGEPSISAPEPRAEPATHSSVDWVTAGSGRWADSLVGVNIGTCTKLMSELIQWGEGRTCVPGGARMTFSTLRRAVDQVHGQVR